MIRLSVYYIVFLLVSFSFSSGHAAEPAQKKKVKSVEGVGPRVDIKGASPGFEKKKLLIGKEKLTVEIADTVERTAHGLMYRKSMPEASGMLFVFSDEKPRSFWMKNTFLELSIGFFDAEKVLLDIQDMRPVTSEMEMNPPTYESAKPAMYALEVNKGWFQKHKIKIGDKFSLK